MKEYEFSISSVMKTTKNKKHYRSPNIEVIGDIKDATRGSIGSGLDVDGKIPTVNPPSGENI